MDGMYGNCRNDDGVFMKKLKGFSVILAYLSFALLSLSLFLMSCSDPGNNINDNGNNGITITYYYIVIFNANGGSGTAPSTKTVKAGSSISLPSGAGLSRRRFIFDGWNTNSSGTGTNYSAGSSYTPTSNVSFLYAKWNAAPPQPYNEPVKEVIFTDSTATVAFENLSGHDIYLVKVNTSNLIVSAASTGGAPSESLQNIIENSLLFGEELPRMGHPAADEFNANPPPIVEEAPRRQRAVFVPPVVDDTKDFWVETYYDSRIFEQRQATLLATGTYGNIWVMNENTVSDTSANTITSTQAQTLAEKFDLIYPLETNLLGYEYGGGPGGDGGKDGDPKAQILIYDMLNASGESAGVAGFFWGKDFYDDPLSNGWRSNLAEIFYISASQINNNPDYSYSTLIHEFQHMINFNQKNVIQGVSSATWYNEMLSMMAEDLIAPLIGVDSTNSNHAIRVRMPRALASYYLEGITEWRTLENISYATKCAFGAYLVRNYGGAELLQSILANNTTNIASITSALDQFQNGLTFEQVLKRYGEAMIFSGSQMPEGVLTFDKTVTKTINGTAYTAYGFNVWNDFTQKGPAVLDLNPRAMRPHSISIHSTNEWKDRTGNLSIPLERPSDPNVVLYLMVN